MAGVLSPSEAWAQACGTWSANLSVAPKAGHESRALTLGWAAGPAACSGWTGTDHIELHRDESASPTAPSSTTLVTATAGANAAFDDLLHRSNKSYYYTVFACENAGCTDYYGDGSGSGEVNGGDTASDTTDPETWELEGVTGESDVTSCVVDDPAANAPHVFIYPSTWPGTGYDLKLAMYYSKSGGTGSASEIYYRLHNAAGWPVGGFNNSASWATAVLVAEGSTTQADDDFAVDHPWSMLTYDGTNYRVQLFAQSQHNNPSYHEKVIQIESTTAVGDDFGLTCSGSSCSTTPLNGAGYVAIDADGTSATSYVNHARHSRVTWDYLGDPLIDAGTDEPFMLFQVERPTSGTCADTGYDDVGWADGVWGSGVWNWTVLTSSSCPAVQITDGHDNANIPLPYGEFKVYYKDFATSEYHVVYWNGTAWEDDTTIEFVWDGSASGPDHACIDNVSTVVYNNGGTVNAGMFFLLLDSDTTCFGTSGVGFDDDGGVSNDDSAIVYAHLSN